MKTLIKYIFIIIFILLPGFLISSCSSSKQTTKKIKKVSHKIIESPTPKVVKNNALLAREHTKKEKIKSIDKIRFDFDENEKPVNGEKLSRILYNKNGFPTKTIIFNSQGSTQYTYTYKYDVNGYRIQTIRADSNGTKDKKYTYEYNKFGNKIKSTRYNMNGIMEKYYLYKYDDSGNLTNELWFNFKGELEYRVNNIFNDEGEKIETDTYNPNNNLIAKYFYHYDSQNNIIEQVQYNEDDQKIGLIQFVYLYYHS